MPKNCPTCYEFSGDPKKKKSKMPDLADMMQDEADDCKKRY